MVMSFMLIWDLRNMFSTVITLGLLYFPAESWYFHYNEDFRIQTMIHFNILCSRRKGIMLRTPLTEELADYLQEVKVADSLQQLHLRVPHSI